MASRTVFDRNLDALRKRSPDVAALLAETSADGIDIEVGPRGAKVIVVDGVRLGSAYDPVKEGQQVAERMAEEPSDVMVAIGFGMGEQFEPFLEANPGTLIIFEPSAARLRTALELRSFREFFETNPEVFVTTDLGTFSRLITGRYAPGLRLRAFPHPAVLRLDAEIVSKAIETTRNAKEVVDTQLLTSIEMLMPWAWMTANNGRRIASSPQTGQLSGLFEGKPAVIAAAGPSLDKQLPLLREIQDRVVVVAIGQTTRSLREAGIEPDLVHIVESADVSHQLTGSGPTESLVTALSNDAHPAIFDVPTRARFSVTTGGASLGTWIAETVGETRFTMGGGTVAQGAVGIAVLMGCNPIALIGQDLAFTDGRAYANNSAYDFVEVDVSDRDDCRFSGMNRKAEMLGKKAIQVAPSQKRGRRVLWVDGWTEGEKVATWSGYASFIEQYREIGIGLRNRGWSLVNCTEGGARIPEIEHRTFQSFADEFAIESLDVREKILKCHDAAPRFGAEDFRDAVEKARKLLGRVESEARKGARFAEKKRDRLLEARSDQQRVEVLRGLARFEKRVRRLLERIPWLDALVQPEIYNSIAATRRIERLDPTDEDLADESAFLFQAAKNGVGRARQWFDAFEASFEEGEAPPAPAVHIDATPYAEDSADAASRADAAEESNPRKWAAPPPA